MIKKFDIENANVEDEMLAFLFGFDNVIERELLRYIYKSRNIACYPNLVLHFVYKNTYCFEHRLRNRLDSLFKFGYLEKTEVNGVVFYSINEATLNEIKTKSL